MFIVDAHLDLAYNALKYERDLLGSVDDIRRAEAGAKLPNGSAMVTFPSLREAGVGVVFASIFVEPGSSRSQTPAADFVYRDANDAYILGQAQLDYYRRLADENEFIKLIGNLDDLEATIASHQDDNDPLIGLVPLMEGADPIRTPDEAEMWYERGLRIIGLAWDDTRYAAGAWRSGGGLTDEGRRLLEIMADMGFILDLSHMAEDATLQALDSFEGPIVATHSNSRALVPGALQLSDVQIRLIAERDGVIGIALGNGFLKAGYRRGDLKESVTLTHIVAHVDHICQIVGDATHVGFGSEFDGDFGVEDAPSGVESHSDFSLIGKALGEYGYTDLNIANIMGSNWLTLLRRALAS